MGKKRYCDALLIILQILIIVVVSRYWLSTRTNIIKSLNQVKLADYVFELEEKGFKMDKISKEEIIGATENSIITITISGNKNKKIEKSEFGINYSENEENIGLLDLWLKETIGVENKQELLKAVQMVNNDSKGKTSGSKEFEEGIVSFNIFKNTKTISFVYKAR